MPFKAKSRYVIQAANPNGSYLRFESRREPELSRDQLSDELRRIADLIDLRLKSGERVQRWNTSFGLCRTKRKRANASRP